jgi:hypothetical protein
MVASLFLDLTSGHEKGKLDWGSGRCLTFVHQPGACPIQENLYRISLGKNVVWAHHQFIYG